MSHSLTWHDVIGLEKEQEYFQQTLKFVLERAAGKVIFRLLKMCLMPFVEFEDVKVVILGQDPLSWTESGTWRVSCFTGSETPPSLVNMYKELGLKILTVLRSRIMAI